MSVRLTVGSYLMRPLDNPESTAFWESFIVTANPDGSRTAQTMSRFPGNTMVRFVTQTVAADFTPIDGFVRIYTDRVYQGAMVRHVTGDTVKSVVLPPDGGALDIAEFPLDTPGMMLSYHPSAVEGWKLTKLDRTHSEPQTIHYLSSSLTWNGGSGGHGGVADMPVRYLGEEEVTVPAGTFLCHHYIWSTGKLDGDLEIWSTGKDEIVAKMNGPHRGFSWELDSYSLTEFGDAMEYVFEDK
jgi:hypothetical protein